MRRTSAFLAALAVAALSLATTACCGDGTCIKDPPCKQCEKPSGGTK
jgi:hypothetical protein